MKANPLNIMIAVCISALLAYGFWSLGNNLANYIAAGSFVFLGGTLVPAIGMSHSNTRLSVNLKVLATVFFVIGLLINAVFALFATSSVFYILASAITFLVFVFLTNTMQNSL